MCTQPPVENYIVSNFFDYIFVLLIIYLSKDFFCVNLSFVFNILYIFNIYVNCLYIK